MTESTVETREGRTAIRLRYEGLNLPVLARYLSAALDLLDARDDALAAAEARVRELEYLDTWAHLNGLNIRDAEQRADCIIEQMLGGLLWSKEAMEGNKAIVRGYLVDHFKEQAARITELEAQLAERPDAT